MEKIKSQNGLKSQRGFIAIVALGILALLIIFGVIVQQTVMDTYTSVKSVNNYYSASDVASSAMEFLQAEVNRTEAGYNTGDVVCEYKEGAANQNNHSMCVALNNIIGAGKVKVTMEIKGRPEENEKLETVACYRSLFDTMNTQCYVIPFPETGDVGQRCDQYDTVFDGGGSNLIDLRLGGDIVGGDNVSDLDQINYSCNWNKLSFGSSLTDRVAIPLYYDDGNNVINPFKDGNANYFVLKIRPPCKPCGEIGDNGLPPGTRECQANQDPTVCPDADRYQLRTQINNANDDNEIVVQWNFSGLCDLNADNNFEEECGLIAIADPNNTNVSAIFESIINNPILGPNIIINAQNIWGIRTHLNQDPDGAKIESMLNVMEKPILTLFLNKALISTEDKNIPYLEYQVLTDYPVGNPKNRIELMVNVDGNIFKKTLSVEEKKPLIDFAVQN